MGEMEKYTEHQFGSREIGRNKSGRWEFETPLIGGLIYNTNIAKYQQPYLQAYPKSKEMVFIFRIRKWMAPIF